MRLSIGPFWILSTGHPAGFIDDQPCLKHQAKDLGDLVADQSILHEGAEVAEDGEQIGKAGGQQSGKPRDRGRKRRTERRQKRACGAFTTEPPWHRG
jgi:hypothetical protein